MQKITPSTKPPPPPAPAVVEQEKLVCARCRHRVDDCVCQPEVIEKVVEVEKIVEVPVERVVEVPVEVPIQVPVQQYVHAPQPVYAVQACGHNANQVCHVSDIYVLDQN